MSDLYPTPAAWDSAYADLRARTEKLDELKATLRTSAAAMATALSAISDAQRTVGRLHVYGSLRADEDLREPRAQERKQQAENWFARMNRLLDEFERVAATPRR